MALFKSSLLSSHFLAILVIILASQAMVEAQVIDGKIDIVVVLNVGSSSSPSMNQDHETEALKDAYADFFPSNFEMSKEKTRLGIVQVTETDGTWGDKPAKEKIVLKLTSDQNEFKRKVQEWIPLTIGNNKFSSKYVYHRNILETLRAIQRIIDKNDKTRAKIAVMVVNSVTETNKWDDTHRMAKVLRDEGVKFYAIVVGNSSHEFQRIEAEGKNYTDGRSRLIAYDDVEMKKPNLMDALKNVSQIIIRDLCGISCRNHQQGKDCQSDRRSPTVFSVNCHAVVATAQCNDDDCHHLCDDHWPWVTDCTTIKCGTMMILRRRGKEPHKGDQNMKDYVKSMCPTTKTCPCSSSTKVSTSTSSMTKSTSQSTASTTTSTSRTTKSTSGSTKPTITQLQNKAASRLGFMKQKTTKTDTEESTSLTTVYIVVGVIVAVVIILIVIGSIFLVGRYQRECPDRLPPGMDPHPPLPPLPKGEEEKILKFIQQGVDVKKGGDVKKGEL